MTFALATLEDLREDLGVTETARDSIYSRCLLEASGNFAQLVGVQLADLCRQVDRVVTFTAKPGGLQHPGPRPLESINEIRSGHRSVSDADMDASDLYLRDPSTYWIEYARTGVIHCMAYGDELKMRVTLTAGWADPSQATPAGAIEVPDEVQSAIRREAVRLWQTRDTAGFQDVDFANGGGGVSMTKAKYHPALKEAASPYRRYTI